MGHRPGESANRHPSRAAPPGHSRAPPRRRAARNGAAAVGRYDRAAWCRRDVQPRGRLCQRGSARPGRTGTGRAGGGPALRRHRHRHHRHRCRRGRQLRGGSVAGRRHSGGRDRRDPGPGHHGGGRRLSRRAGQPRRGSEFRGVARDLPAAGRGRGARGCRGRPLLARGRSRCGHGSRWQRHAPGRDAGRPGHGSHRLSHRSRYHGSHRLSRRSRYHGSHRLSRRSRYHGSHRLSHRSRYHGPHRPGCRHCRSGPGLRPRQHLRACTETGRPGAVRQSRPAHPDPAQRTRLHRLRTRRAGGQPRHPVA